MIPQKSLMFNPKDKHKLKVVRLTPPGKSAVASILLSGPDAADIFSKFWLGPVLQFEAKPIFGRFRFQNSDQAEEIVVHAICSTEIEIHGHGGSVVQDAIESVLIAEGAEPADWQNIFVPGISQQELALQLLPYAVTERTAQILLDQFNGALDRELNRIKTLKNEDEKQSSLKRLRENAKIGKHLVKPFDVVFAGGVNVGKSSLLNAILGFQRTIADSMPGTTRDAVSAQTALDGFPVQIWDTAGFRDILTNDDQSELERQGIERSEDSIAEADLVVWLADSTVPPKKQQLIPEMISGTKKILLCFNKIDRSELHIPDEAIAVSAATGQGIEELLRQIFQRLVPNPPKLFEAVPLGDWIFE